VGQALAARVTSLTPHTSVCMDAVPQPRTDGRAARAGRIECGGLVADGGNPQSTPRDRLATSQASA